MPQFRPVLRPEMPFLDRLTPLEAFKMAPTESAKERCRGGPIHCTRLSTDAERSGRCQRNAVPKCSQSRPRNVRNENASLLPFEFALA
jgi:hypothetical protein